MSTIRKKHTPKFKWEIVVANLAQHATQAELVSKYQVHQTQINTRTKHVKENGHMLFEQQHKDKDNELITSELYEQIGQLQYQLSRLKKKSGISIQL